MIPVEGHKGLYRDSFSNGIFNSNDNEYNEYIKLKKKIIDEKNEIKKLKYEIDELKIIVNRLIN